MEIQPVVDTILADTSLGLNIVGMLEIGQRIPRCSIGDFRCLARGCSVSCAPAVDLDASPRKMPLLPKLVEVMQSTDGHSADP